VGLDASALVTRIRLEAGKPPVDIVPDANIENWIAEALEEFDRYIPNWATSYIETVGDQPDYSVHEDAIEVVFVGWAGGRATMADIFGGEFDVEFPAEGYDVMLDQVTQYVDALKAQQIADRADWDWNEATEKLWLLPPPSTTGDRVYYIYIKAWTLALCKDRFEKFIVWYAISQALKVRARRQKRLSAISHTGGQFPWTLSDPELKDARTLEKKFYDAMTVESKKAPTFWA